MAGRFAPSALAEFPPPLPVPWTAEDEFRYRELTTELAMLNQRRMPNVNSLATLMSNAGFHTGGMDWDGALTHVAAIRKALAPFDLNDAPQVKP